MLPPIPTRLVCREELLRRLEGNVGPFAEGAVPSFFGLEVVLSAWMPPGKAALTDRDGKVIQVFDVPIS